MYLAVGVDSIHFFLQSSTTERASLSRSMWFGKLLVDLVWRLVIGISWCRCAMQGRHAFRTSYAWWSSCQQDDVTWWLIQLNKSKRDIVQSASDGMWHAARWNAADCCRSYQVLVLDLSSFPYYSYLRNTKYLSWETPAETIAISKRITKNKNNGITIKQSKRIRHLENFRISFGFRRKSTCFHDQILTKKILSNSTNGKLRDRQAKTKVRFAELTKKAVSTYLCCYSQNHDGEASKLLASSESCTVASISVLEEGKTKRVSNIWNSYQ